MPSGPSSCATAVVNAQVLLVGQSRAVGQHGVDSSGRGAPDQLAVGRVVELQQHRHTRPRGGGLERGEQALAALRAATEPGPTRTITGAARASAARTTASKPSMS